MATNRELDILAREAWHLINKEGVKQEMAVMSVLNAHKDIVWYDGIKKDIGVRISTLRQEQKKQTAKSAKPFATFAEKSLPENDK